MIEPARKAIYFALPQWLKLKNDQHEWPFAVVVRALPQEEDAAEQMYVVVSYVRTNRIKEEWQERANEVVKKLRKAYMRRLPQMREKLGHVTLRADRTVPGCKAEHAIGEAANPLFCQPSARDCAKPKA